MKWLSQVRVIWLSTLIVVFLEACGSPQANIVGKWADKTSSVEALEFFKDKTFTMNDGPKKAVFTGKWNVLDDGRIKVDLVAFGMPTVMFFVLIGEELEVNMGGEKRRLVRLK